MGEHKFRAWDKKEKRWLNEFDFAISGEGEVYLYTQGLSEDGFTRLTEDLELVEYIGIKDLNDNEVYRGDIVKIKRSGFFEYVSEVRFLHGSYCVSQFGTYAPIFCLARLGDVIEIIGNVYDNPELMEIEQ